MTYPVVDEGQIDLAHIPRLFPKFPNKEDPGIKISSTSVITSRRRKERRCIKPTKESQTIRTKRDSTSAGGLSLSAANVGRIPGQDLVQETYLRAWACDLKPSVPRNLPVIPNLCQPISD